MRWYRRRLEGWLERDRFPPLRFSKNLSREKAMTEKKSPDVIKTIEFEVDGIQYELEVFRMQPGDTTSPRDKNPVLFGITIEGKFPGGDYLSDLYVRKISHGWAKSFEGRLF